MSTPMLDVARELLTDEAAKSAFEDDPEGFLADRGLADWAPGELAEALGYVTEVLPPDTAAELPTADALLDGDADAPGSLAQLSDLAPEAVAPVGADTAALDGLEPGEIDYGAGAGPDGTDEDAEEPGDDSDEVPDDLGDMVAEVPDDPAGDAGEEPTADDEDGASTSVGDDGGEGPPDPLSGLE